MHYDEQTTARIRAVSILDIATALGIQYSDKGTWRQALCFCHDDHHPSLKINEAKNRWKCFACNHEGDNVGMVMEHEELDYPGALEWIAKKFDIEPLDNGEPRRQELHLALLPNANAPQMASPAGLEGLVKTVPSTDSDFCRALVQTGILSPSQMRHAAERYHLGSSGDGGVIFWQMDQEEHVHEGKVMYYQADAHRSHSRNPVIVSWLLKNKQTADDGSPLLDKDWTADFCLFGLHTLMPGDGSIVAVVESEKTAVICSELLPEARWAATGGESFLSVRMLQPLRDRRIIIFPDTDPTGKTFAQWRKVALEAARTFGHPVTCSDILERLASTEQKARKIDIADFLLEHPHD